MEEGKAAVSFEGYGKIAKKCIQAENDFRLATFAHLFTILSWNLMTRSVSTSDILFNNLSWENDSLVVKLVILY